MSKAKEGCALLNAILKQRKRRVLVEGRGDTKRQQAGLLVLAVHHDLGLAAAIDHHAKGPGNVFELTSQLWPLEILGIGAANTACESGRQSSRHIGGAGRRWRRRRRRTSTTTSLLLQLYCYCYNYTTTTTSANHQRQHHDDDDDHDDDYYSCTATATAPALAPAPAPAPASAPAPAPHAAPASLAAPAAPGVPAAPAAPATATASKCRLLLPPLHLPLLLPGFEQLLKAELKKLDLSGL